LLVVNGKSAGLYMKRPSKNACVAEYDARRREDIFSSAPRVLRVERSAMQVDSWANDYKCGCSFIMLLASTSVGAVKADCLPQLAR
jgi:hypothetical protein